METPLDQFDLWTGLIGGLALFLFGMDQMTEALKRAAGARMVTLLARVTRNRVVGLGAGALVTALVNSSSITTVILVGFISAGLMSMAQSVPVILGANIGSTFTAQILAFNVTRFALPMIAAGVLVPFLTRNEDRRDWGRMLLGAGLVFYGMGVMSGAMAPLRSHPPFVAFLAAADHPLAGVLLGAVFTAVVQSSAATAGIVIILAGQGIMPLETAVAIILGANIGTCATAALAVIGKPREARRTALVHIIFNVVGVLLWVGFVPELAALARAVSPGAFNGEAAHDLPRQVANAHTVFNLVNALLFLPVTGLFARVVERLLPDRPEAEEGPLAPKMLDEMLLSAPPLALRAARAEIGRMGAHVAEMLEKALPAALSSSRDALRRIEEMDRPLDRLHRAVIGYLGRVSSGALSAGQADDLMRLVAVANDLERIGDGIATDLTTSARKRIDERVAPAADAARRIALYHAQVLRALREAVTAVAEEDPALAGTVRDRKRELVGISEQIGRERFRSGPQGAAANLTAYVREVEILEILDDIFKLARRIARSALR